MLSKWAIVYCANVIEGALLILMNSIAATTILSSKKLRRPFGNILLALLFIAHTICGILSVFFGIMEIEYRGDGLISIGLVIRDFFAGYEVVYTIFLSIERFVAISNPMFYSKFGKKHAIGFVVIVSSLPVVFVTWRILSSAAFVAVFIVTLVGSILITISNIYLYRSIKRHCQDISSKIVADSQSQKLEKKLLIEKRKMKGLRICVLISASYTISWVPIGVKFFIKFVLGIKKRAYWDAIFTFVAYFNGFQDVFIFFYVKKTARLQLMSLFCCGKQTVSNSVHPFTTQATAGESNLAVSPKTNQND